MINVFFDKVFKFPDKFCNIEANRTLENKFEICYSDDMIIREFKNNDIEQIKDLLVELQQYVIEIDKYNLNIISGAYRDKYFEYMIDDLKTQQGKIYIAEENGAIIGFIAGYVQTYDERDKLDYTCPNKGIVAELIVSKNVRSKGTGQILLNKMEEYFKSINCEYIQIDVFAYNKIAENFYRKNNYEERMLTLFKKLK